jgi:hypothetical protein
MSIEAEIIHCLCLDHFVQKGSAYRFLCPYCQVGRKSKRGKRFTPGEAKGFLYQTNYGWNFKCHRENHCGRHTSFAIFLEENFPDDFLNYVHRRDELGLAGYQTNCPSLKTVLKRLESLPNHPPKTNDPTHAPKPSEPTPEAPIRQSKCSGGETMALIKLPPMRSPQQQAGHQSRINQEIKQRERQRRERSGELC